MKKESSKKSEQLTRTCCNCGKAINESEIWYPTIDISTCGGGVLYSHARCMIEQIFDQTKEDLLERVTNAEKEADDLMSDEMLNFYAFFPISPVHWVKYAMDEDKKEILKIIKENKEAIKKQTIMSKESDTL